MRTLLVMSLMVCALSLVGCTDRDAPEGAWRVDLGASAEQTDGSAREAASSAVLNATYVFEEGGVFRLAMPVIAEGHGGDTTVGGRWAVDERDSSLVRVWLDSAVRDVEGTPPTERAWMVFRVEGDRLVALGAAGEAEAVVLTRD
jgi:hypothetical protein